MSKKSLEEENVCLFYLQKKKRYCRMKKVEGKAFCPHHSCLGLDENGKWGARIPCPYDSSHFCYEVKYQKHLKKCNAREKEKPAYFVENINVSNEDAKSEGIKVGLNDVTDAQLMDIIELIKKIYIENNLVVHEEYAKHPNVLDEMKKCDDGLNNFKHMRQQASLLALMESQKFLSSGSCFIEFGAGKGQLMHWVVKCVPDKEKCSFILIDRSAQRHKSDNKFKGTGIHLERIRMDIQHLCLAKIQSIQSKVQNVVGVCKHLCGSATDLALRCLTNTLEIEADDKSRNRALGVVMALCCHHRCTWNSYVGQEYLISKGFSERNFKIMCCMASWATCGLRKRDPHKISEATNEENLQSEHSTSIVSEEALNRYVRMNLKHEEREEIGMQCKRLIDCGRVDYLQKLGYEAKLVSYIEKSVSLENIALVATYSAS